MVPDTKVLLCMMMVTLPSVMVLPPRSPRLVLNAPQLQLALGPRPPRSLVLAPLIFSQQTHCLRECLTHLLAFLVSLSAPQLHRRLLRGGGLRQACLNHKAPCIVALLPRWKTLSSSTSLPHRLAHPMNKALVQQ